MRGTLIMTNKLIRKHFLFLDLFSYKIQNFLKRWIVVILWDRSKVTMTLTLSFSEFIKSLYPASTLPASEVKTIKNRSKMIHLYTKKIFNYQIWSIPSRAIFCMADWWSISRKILLTCSSVSLAPQRSTSVTLFTPTTRQSMLAKLPDRGIPLERYSGGTRERSLLSIFSLLMWVFASASLEKR